jgi:hypothetical protein
MSKGLGRPRLPEGKGMKNNDLPVYFPDEDTVLLVKAAARKAGMTFSAWARQLLIRAARLELGKKDEP